LTRGHFEATGADFGPSELEYLQVIEADERGEVGALVAFDPDDLDAAYAELEARYGAGEAAPYAADWQATIRFFEALAARNWDPLAAIFAPGFVVEDHRPLGLLDTLSRDEYVASVRALVELRPDATFRLEHVLALDDHRVLVVARWLGGDADGMFEIPVVNAVGLGPDGARQYHFYDLDQLDEAWARYEALRHDPPSA
jgi:hypothetical protein